MIVHVRYIQNDNILVPLVVERIYVHLLQSSRSIVSDLFFRDIYPSLLWEISIICHPVGLPWSNLTAGRR
jgi:hypothetical protein